MPRFPRPSRLAGGLALMALLAVPVLAPRDAHGQLLKRLKETVKQAAEDETLNQVDRLVRGKVKCVFDDLECIRQAEKSGKGAVLTDDDGEILVDGEGKPVSDPDEGARLAGAGKTLKPGEGAWANYDFQPGDDLLLYDDYTRDEVGDFPRRFALVQGNYEIIEWEGGRYLRATSGGIFAIPLPRTLPERFTIEYGVSLKHGNSYVRVMPGRAFTGPARTYRGSAPSVQASEAGLVAVQAVGPQTLTGIDADALRNGIVPVRIMADGDHMKMYFGERRVANAPNAVFPRSDTLFVALSSANEKNPILIGPIRIAGGGRDLYDRLARDGRVATQGILFASGSARIRPESTPTLAEIGAMLGEHPDLRLAIEGHTDGDGDDAFNLDLSERRAAAVKVYLVEQLSIEGARLETAGFGEARPVAENDNPEGKQRNRRVELVRLDR
jgi:outer membrane protein OmpA-like peptidoglycan-associated protein